MSGRIHGPEGGADDGSDPTLRLRIPNDVASLCSALESIDAFLERHGIGDTAVFTVRLAAEEIVTNIIKYTYLDSARHEIGIDLRLAPDHLILQVADDGQEFDPLAAPPPDLALPLEQKAVGGVGIHLVRTLADRLEYARVEGQNVLSATIRIDSEP